MKNTPDYLVFLCNQVKMSFWWKFHHWKFHFDNFRQWRILGQNDNMHEKWQYSCKNIKFEEFIIWNRKCSIISLWHKFLTIQHDDGKDDYFIDNHILLVFSINTFFYFNWLGRLSKWPLTILLCNRMAHLPLDNMAFILGDNILKRISLNEIDKIPI